MRRAGPWLTQLVVLAAIFGAACNRDKKAEQMAALNRGFEAGLLTDEEYAAKKAAILGTVKPMSAAPAPAAAPMPAPAAPPPAASEPAVAKAPSPPSNTPPAPRRSPATPTAKRAPEVTEAPPPPTPTPAPPVVTEPPPAPKESPAVEESEPAPLAGCPETGSKPGKEKGKQERFFPLPMAKVKEAAISALEALEFKVNKDSGSEIEATRKRHIGLIGSGGERMVLRFEPATEGTQRGTLAIGETKKGIVGRVGQKSWTNAVLAQTGCMLRKSGSSHAGR